MIVKTKFHTGRYDHTFLSLVIFDNKFLKQIIYEVLNIKVEKAKIINSKMAKKRLMERANYLDLVVETEIGYINIEVSNGNYNKYIAHRNFIYLTTLIGNATKAGMRLEEMPKVYQINLIFGKSNNVDISKYNMYSKEDRKILTKKFRIFNVYMDKLKEMYYNDNKKLTDKLSLVGLTMTREELEENKWHNEMLIRSAKEEGLEMGIEQGLERGFKQGLEQRDNVIRNMLKKKFDIKTISEITGLTPENIIEISKA